MERDTTIGGWRRKGCWPGPPRSSPPDRSKTLENRTKNVELGAETIHRSSARPPCRDSGHRSPGTRLDRFHDTIYHRGIRLLFKEEDCVRFFFLSFLHRSFIYERNRRRGDELSAIENFKSRSSVSRIKFVDR